jgi:hypothetical protein
MSKAILALSLAGAWLAGLVAPAAAADFTTQTVTVGVRKNMEATLFTPNGAGPFPSVLVMHTSFGITEADRGYCANLARGLYLHGARLCTEPPTSWRRS